MVENNRSIAPSFLFSNPAHFFALGFGSGLSPVAPGTVGTLAAIPCWLLIGTLDWPLQFAVVVLAFFIGVAFCAVTSRNLGVHDHGGIVWDEFVGLWIALLFAPGSGLALLAGFVLFRLFDIIKPWPIRWLDKKVHGGLGIMIDDVVAGLFAGIGLYLLQMYGLL